jgi:hypothetical protein
LSTASTSTVPPRPKTPARLLALLLIRSGGVSAARAASTLSMLAAVSPADAVVCTVMP